MDQLTTQRLFHVAMIAALLLAVGCRGKPSTPAASQANQNQNQQQEQILNTVREITAKVLEVDPKTIDVDTPLAKQKAPADEVDATDIILGIEDTFEIEIKEEETGGTEHLADRLTVRKLAELVARKKQGS